MTLRLAVILGLVILVGGAAHVAAAETHEVIVTAEGFSPATLTIKQGDTVKWVWEAGAGSHELLDGDPEDMDNAGKLFDIPLSESTPDHSKTWTFQELGTVSYFSRTNPSLFRGTITVTGATPVNRRTWGWLKSVYEGA